MRTSAATDVPKAAAASSVVWAMLRNMQAVLRMIASGAEVAFAPEGFDARLVLAEAEKAGGPVIHVARDDKRMAAMAEALRFFAPDMPVIRFPGWDCLPYDRISPNAEISATRMATLAALVHGMPPQFVLLTTLNAATQRLPARAVLREAAQLCAGCAYGYGLRTPTRSTPHEHLSVLGSMHFMWRGWELCGFGLGAP